MQMDTRKDRRGGRRPGEENQLSDLKLLVEEELKKKIGNTTVWFSVAQFGMTEAHNWLAQWLTKTTGCSFNQVTIGYRQNSKH